MATDQMRILGGAARLSMIREGLEKAIEEAGASVESMVPNGWTSGDTKLVWNSDDAIEVEAARRSFDFLRGKGFASFKVAGEGRRGEQIREFSPEAGALIMAPQMSGG
jgi:hypothetical protein